MALCPSCANFIVFRYCPDGKSYLLLHKKRDMEKLQGIADTLYIPLVARIIVSKQFPDYFRDEKALELEANLPAKWQHIMLASREYENMASVARYYNIDDMTRRFIARNERCNIIHLGAGLDTSYHRIKPTSAKAKCSCVFSSVPFLFGTASAGEKKKTPSRDMWLGAIT